MADTTQFSADELRQIRDVYPSEWVDDGAAIGNSEHCARRAREHLDAGADRVILHGNAPKDLATVKAAFEQLAP